MTTRIAISNQTHSAAELRETCHNDKRGRMIGGYVVRSEADAVVTVEGEWPEGATVYQTPHKAPVGPDGRTYMLRVHAARNGASYGASQSLQFFPTAAARDAAVEAYFVGMEKRARKTAEKGGAA